MRNKRKQSKAAGVPVLQTLQVLKRKMSRYCNRVHAIYVFEKYLPECITLQCVLANTVRPTIIDGKSIQKMALGKMKIARS